MNNQNNNSSNNYEQYAPTDVRLGKGLIGCMDEELRKYGKKVLLLHDENPEKKSLYAKISGALKGFDITELTEIDANPKLSSVRKGVSLCKKGDIEVVLAIGGRNVIDTAKFIAAAVYFDGELRNMAEESVRLTKALPVLVVLTGAATGTETDCSAMICCEETGEKEELSHPLLYPKLAVCDPTYQFGLTKKETAEGIMAVFSRIMEMKLQLKGDGYIEEQLSDLALKTLIEYGPVALEEPENYEVRYHLLWIGAVCLGQLASFRRGVVRSVHPMAMELSGYYDIPYEVGLPLLMTEWMRFVLTEETEEKFAAYARKLWNVTYDDDHTAARVGIDRLEAFFRKLGMPRMLSDLDIDDSRFSVMASAAVEKGKLTEEAYVSLSASDVEQIYRNCW